MKNYSFTMEVSDTLKAREQQTTPEEPDSVVVRLATDQDAKYALLITREMRASAIARGTGIAYRSAESICQKMSSGHAIIATTREGKWVGFSYIESWENGRFVSNSGMIVSPEYRKKGVAKVIKEQIMDLCHRCYPSAEVFSITSSSAIMKMNTKFGFAPVAFEEITRDRNFWNHCRNCVNFPILESKQFKNCLCTAMLYCTASKNPM
jgi:GNAT superfamily N-acetyltransferase